MLTFPFVPVAQCLHSYCIQVSLIFVCGFMNPTRAGLMPPEALLITNYCEHRLGNKSA